MSKDYLLDVNALIALTDSTHVHYRSVQKWFDSIGTARWGICPISEAGLVRFATNPNSPAGQRSFEEVAQVLAELAKQPGFFYWPVSENWAGLTAPFASRLFGHQQVTDAFLLGVAIKEDVVLVSFDKGIAAMAGPEYRKHLLLLE